MTDEAHQAIDRVFQLVDREVWIVTAAADQRRGGLVATWVSQASIDAKHPRAAVGLAPNHFTTQLVAQSGAFGLHLVRADQIELVWNFGLDSGQDRDKLEGLAATARATGSPILENCLAWLDCRVTERFEMADRWYFWADVIAGNVVGRGAALKQSQLFSAANGDQLARMAKNLERDIQIQRRSRSSTQSGQ